MRLPHWKLFTKNAGTELLNCLLRTCLCEIKILPTFFNLLSWHFCFKWVNLIIANSLHYAQIQELSHSCPYNNQQHILSPTKLVRNLISLHIGVLMIISGPHTVLRTHRKSFSDTVTKYQHNRLLRRKGCAEITVGQGPVHQRKAEP